MGKSIFDHISNLDTLLAVVVGALLATGGALIAETIQDHRRRKQTSQEAAKALGQILSAIRARLELFFRSRRIGEPWGDTTILFLKAVVKEIEWFEQHRHLLFDLPDLELRIKLSVAIARLTMPPEPLIEVTYEIRSLQRRLADDRLTDDTERAALQTELDGLEDWRSSSLTALEVMHGIAYDVFEDLERVAGVKFNFGLDVTDLIPTDIRQTAETPSPSA